MTLKNPFTGFRYAAEGIAHVFRTQKHMRFHFFAFVAVITLSRWFDLGRGETLVLLLTISLVMTAEMLNTAVEAVVDLVTQEYHPLAKFAKDIAAGAVLMATMNALAVGFILLLGGAPISKLESNLGIGNVDVVTVVILALALLLALVVVQKVSGDKGQLLRGGVVSGHTALGFFFAATIIFTSPNHIAKVCAILLALLVAQSRIDAGIHTFREVVYGALVATLVALLAYYFLWV